MCAEHIYAHAKFSLGPHESPEQWDRIHAVLPAVDPTRLASIRYLTLIFKIAPDVLNYGRWPESWRYLFQDLHHRMRRWDRQIEVILFSYSGYEAQWNHLADWLQDVAYEAGLTEGFKVVTKGERWFYERASGHV